MEGGLDTTGPLVRRVRGWLKVYGPPQTEPSSSPSQSYVRFVCSSAGFCRLCLRPPHPQSSAPRRQPCGSVRTKQYGIREQADDIRAQEISTDVARLGRAVGRTMDPIRSKSIRRRSLTDMGPGRRSSLTEAVAVDSGTLETRISRLLPNSDERDKASSSEADL